MKRLLKVLLIGVIAVSVPTIWSMESAQNALFEQFKRRMQALGGDVYVENGHVIIRCPKIAWPGDYIHRVSLQQADWAQRLGEWTGCFERTVTFERNAQQRAEQARLSKQAVQDVANDKSFIEQLSTAQKALGIGVVACIIWLYFWVQSQKEDDDKKDNKHNKLRLYYDKKYAKNVGNFGTRGAFFSKRNGTRRVLFSKIV